MFKIIAKETFVFFIIYTFWCFAYSISNELFYHYCQPKRIIECFLAPFYDLAPHCKIVIWIQENSRNVTNHMILTSMTWVIRLMGNYLMLPKNTNTKKNE